MEKFLLCLPAIFFLVLVIGCIVFIVWYFKTFYAERAERQRKAEAQRDLHGGECILEWNGSFAEGPADAEFGRLVVEIPKKRGGAAARFCEKGLILDKRRLSYSEIKDILLVAASTEKRYTLKQAVQDMGVLWIYPKKGTTIGIREMTYQFDNEVMEKIKSGLGF